MSMIDWGEDQDEIIHDKGESLHPLFLSITTLASLGILFATVGAMILGVIGMPVPS